MVSNVNKTMRITLFKTAVSKKQFSDAEKITNYVLISISFKTTKLLNVVN